MARARVRARSIGRAVDEVESRHAARSAILLDDHQTLGRDAADIATGPAFDLVQPWPVSSSNTAVRSILLEVEDGRTFNPDIVRKPRSTRSWRPRLAVPMPGRSLSPGYGLSKVAFKYPRKIAVCIRRKIRKGVLMATGKGGGKHRRPRRNKYSSIWC